MKQLILIVLILAMVAAKPRFAKDVDVDGENYQLGKVFESHTTDIEPEEIEVRHVLVLQSDIEQTASPEDVEYTDPCNIKQGYLTQITAIDQALKLKYSDEHLTVLLHGRPVFAVLNKQILSLFENENVNSLIKSINIKQIDVPQIVDSFKPQFCFQLDFAEVHPIMDEPTHVENPSHNALLTLCANSAESLQDWSEAIPQFHNCRQEVGAKFEQLTLQEQIETRKQQIKDEEEQAKADAIKEQQQSNEVSHKFQEENEKENEMFQDTIQELSEIITKSQQFAVKERSESEEKQKKLQEETEQLQREKMALEKLLMAKAAEEEVQTELLIKAEQAESQKTIFEQAKEMFKKAKDEENKKVLRTQQQLIEDEERRQKELKQDMVNEAIQAELDLPADDCFSEELTTDFDTHAKQTCYAISKNSGQFDQVDVQLLGNCLDRNRFCETCCNFHIGIIHGTKRANCQNECTSKLFHAEEDLGIKVTPDAVDVRIPRVAKLTDENTTPEVHLRFKQTNINKKIADMSLRFKQAPQTKADKEFNAKQLKLWRDNVTQAKKEKAEKEKIAQIKKQKLENSVKTAEQVLEHTAELQQVVKEAHAQVQRKIQKQAEIEKTIDLAQKIAQHAKDARARFLRR